MALDNQENSQKDHEERFLKAFEEYSDALFRHAFLRISDRERAIDVVHDTFAKVWTYVRNGHEIKSYRPFLYKVLNNLIIDEYRKAKEASLDALMESEGVDEGSFNELSEDTVKSLVATLDGRKAFDLLVEIPDTYREVLVLRFVDELGPKEISELIEESENVISVRLFRGLKLLKTLITKQEEAMERKRLAKKAS
ncbi:RNA polymerase sigma factor [Candidatus Kaiserbacteria bacterium]|nr:RNA polymerase sigma factor [Candidatus Kaiserbacteria bacterium]